MPLLEQFGKSGRDLDLPWEDPPLPIPAAAVLALSIVGIFYSPGFFKDQQDRVSFTTGIIVLSSC